MGGARRTRNRSRSDNVGGMAGEPAPEEVAAGEEGAEETTAEEVTVSGLKLSVWSFKQLF